MPEENNTGSIEPEKKPRPVVLLLLDGWGIAPPSEANAFTAAKTPTFLELIREYPVAVLSAAGKDLNTRYLTIGAGQEIPEDNITPLETLTSVLAAAGRTQIKIAETERFAALTHYFNGLAENKARGEEWKIISSQAGDQTAKPLLALKRTVKEIIKETEAAEPRDLIIAAIPYLHLVAASGELSLIKKAIEELDKYLRQIVSAVTGRQGVLIISAASGNVEKIRNLATDLVDTEITDNPVPLVIIGPELKGKTIGLADPLSSDLSSLAPAGSLVDLAPTVLHFLGLAAPTEMTGHSLIDL